MKNWLTISSAIEAKSAALTRVTHPIDTVLYLYDSSGKLLASNDDEFESTDSSIVDYVLPADGTDTQSPHQQDEMYYVVRGRGRMRAGSEDQAVSAGSIIFVLALATEIRHYRQSKTLAAIERMS